MPLEKIYVVRHGFRSNWSVDPVTGIYTATVPSPTGIPADPALTSHGLCQARELADHLMTLDPPAQAVYSSPFYRCLQTLGPYIELRQGNGRPPLSPDHAPPHQHLSSSTIRPEHGLREWFGPAPFDQPEPASAHLLRSIFPAYDADYRSLSAPLPKGERLAQLWERVAVALAGIIAHCDANGIGAVLLCTHAAVVIVIGRILTARSPTADDGHDFKAYTCGLSVYRRQGPLAHGEIHCSQGSPSAHPIVRMKEREDLIGPWLCELDSDCSFLSGGEERGWAFSGDESFPEAQFLGRTDVEPKL